MSVCDQIGSSRAAITNGEATALGKVESITEHGRPPEFSLRCSLDDVGISLLCDWDVFVFVYRHVVSLTSAEQIARLVGYESNVVGSALDRLERQKLIERSRPSRGVRLYRVLDLKDSDHRRRLRELVTQSESRPRRLELAKQLNPVQRECVPEEPSSLSPIVKGEVNV